MALQISPSRILFFRRERRGQQLLHAQGEALRAARRVQLRQGVRPRAAEGKEGVLATMLMTMH